MESNGSSERTAGSRLHRLRSEVVAPRGASILGSATDRHYRYEIAKQVGDLTGVTEPPIESYR